MTEAAKPSDGRPPLLFPYFMPARELSGVGASLLVALRRLTGSDEPRLMDLLFTIPSAQRDLEPLVDAMAFEDGLEVTLGIAILGHRPAPRGGRAPYRIEAMAGDTPVDLVFFRAHQSWLEQIFPEGGQRLVAGRLQLYRDRWQIAHPEPVPDDPADRARAAMVYPLSEGLKQARLRKLMAQALDRVPDLPEWLDPHHVARRGLPTFRRALEILHGATEDGDPAAARERLALDELLAMQLALRLVRSRREAGRGRARLAPGMLVARLLDALPFSPTGAQSRSIAEIRADLDAERPMTRLLMGDVGSGKTLVALAAMLHVVEAGAQAALMAPTEILARQHARGLAELGARIGVEVALLTGQDSASQRATTLAAMADGSLKIVVGTHALFQEGVAFADLGLAVIDEQHRFGVHQRLDLVAKGDAVDVLLMTATPIPRSLVMSHYGDVDTSRLDEMPAGRQPVRTVVLPVARLADVLDGVGRALVAKERVFWVCPVIDTAEEAETATAEGRHAQLAEHFASHPDASLEGCVGLVHGRLPGTEKDERMRAFTRGDIRLLVATTVVEVGVDVPEATVIVIDGAERFGLAQLHQLRGRVGRGERASSCVLLYNQPLGPLARARLEIMRETTDGFRIAEEDLRLRGPGEILGARQSGLPRLRFADLENHTEQLILARDDARTTVIHDPSLQGERGKALRLLLQLFERFEAARVLAAG